MKKLARWAGYLSIAGGVLMAGIIVIVSFTPDTTAWNGFFVVVVLLGAAVLGFGERLGNSLGRLGRWSAWLSALGAIGILLTFAYALATNQYSSSGTESDPLTPLWLVVALAWFLGALGFAAALIRGRALSPLGAWLILAGAVIGVVVSIVGGENPPPTVFLAFLIFCAGWIVLGYTAGRQATD